MRSGWGLLGVALLLASCEKVTEHHVIGHKGKAKADPYLAATRFLEEYGYTVESAPGWPSLDDELAVAVVPASALASEGYVRQLDVWVIGGGHAIITLQNGEGHLGDWSSWEYMTDVELSEGLLEWFGELGLEAESEDDVEARKISVLGGEFEVWMDSQWRIGAGEEEAVVSLERGDGRLSVMSEARPIRNRWIGDHDHAALLLALMEASPYEGSVVFVRHAGLSLWRMVWEHGAAGVVGIAVLVIFWLWRNLPRFGPLDSKEGAGTLRAYDHHLEALGDFQWRLDRGEGLLRPLRNALIERTQRLAIASGRPDESLFVLMGERAGIPAERAERAMTIERPRDPAGFTRLVADLQSIHLSIP